MMINFVSAVVYESALWAWLHRLGGPGLILLGLADNSVVPLPGSMDVFVVLLTAHHPSWWPYYASMAVVGAVLGGFVTYRLAAKGGEETLEKKIGKRKAEKVYRRFKKHGFGTIVIGAILPPPFPVVPFLLAAGALHYPKKNFIAALALGRAVRFFALAYVARVYGKQIIHWGSQYYQPILDSLIGLAVLAGIGALVYFTWWRPRKQREERKKGQKVEQFPIPFRNPEHSEQKQRRAK